MGVTPFDIKTYVGQYVYSLGNFGCEALNINELKEKGLLSYFRIPGFRWMSVLTTPGRLAWSVLV